MRSVATLPAAMLSLALGAAPALALGSDAPAPRDEKETSATTAPAQQQPADMEKRVKELEEKLAKIEAEKAVPEATLMNQEEQERVLEPVVLSGFYDNGYLVASSSDGRFKYWLDGRVNLDAATYSGAENRLPTGAEVRRARIGVKATLFKDWLAEIDVDFADNAVEMKDVWMGYAGFSNSVFRVGNHKAPFGFETLTSSKNIIFMERPYIDAWAPDRLLGVSYSRWGKHWQASAGLFAQAGGDWNDKDTLTGGGAGSDQGWSLIGRFSVAPLNEKGKVLHLGAAFANRHPDAAKIATSGADLPDREHASRLIKFDSRAETHVSRAKFVSTGDLKYTESYNQLGLELAGVLGPVTVQGEYQKSDVNRYATKVATYLDHSFDGYYGQVSVFLTGDQRPYYTSEGEFGRVIPKHSAGAVELGVRYSTIDLNDITTVDPIKGGAAMNFTAGITWFINANHKIMFNVTTVDNDEYAKPNKEYAPLPTGTSTSQVPVLGDDFTTFQVRYQLAF